MKYIKQAVEMEGENASLHLKYVLALAYRGNKEWDKANAAYSPIMKNEETILEYRTMINGFNKKMLDGNLTEDLGSLHFHLDIYSHFKEMGLVRPHNFNINLHPYYDITEGW